MTTTSRRGFLTFTGVSATALALFGLNQAETAEAAELQPLVQRVVDLPGLEVSFYLDEDNVPDAIAHLILKRPISVRNSGYVFQDLGRVIPETTEEVAKWLGGQPSEWTITKEELGNAYVFKAKDANVPVPLRVPFGGLDFDNNGPASAWSTVNVTVATWRPSRPKVKRQVNQEPPKPKAACIRPEGLAQQKGWTVIKMEDAKYGGLRVKLEKADSLPDEWEGIGPRRIGVNDTDRSMAPGEWVIYTPFRCRGELGFQ